MLQLSGGLPAYEEVEELRADGAPVRLHAVGVGRQLAVQLHDDALPRLVDLGCNSIQS